MAREVPNVPTGLDPQTRNFFSAIREAVNQFTLNGGGSSADSLNSNLTVDNLTGISDSLDKLLATTIPPIPTGVTVTGVFSTIMVTWNNPNYAYYSFAEIWRANALDSSGLLIPATGSNANGHSINFANDAKLVGTSNGNIYTDSVTPGSKYYYWVRFLSMADIAGPYNASTGIIGATVQNIDDLMIANGWTVQAESIWQTGQWIGNAAILNGAINSLKMADFAITESKMADLAITTAKLNANAVTNAKIIDGAITEVKVGTDAITSPKIAALAVTNAKIGNLAVDNSKIANLAVDNAKIAALAVDAAKIANAAITNAKIDNLAVDGAKIALLAVDSTKITDAAITNAKIANLAVDNAKIANLAVDTGKIANAAITNAKIANLAVSTAQIQDAAVTNAKIASLAVEKLYATAAWIASADILDGSITNAKIGNTIQSDNYNGTTLGWQLSKSGGTVNLNQLTIRDAAGNIILSSGTGIPWAAVAAGGGKAADNATVGATFGSDIYGQITPANVSTYIANAAIKTAQIGDLAVDTLQIAGNAVTIPASAYSAAGQALGGGNQEIQALYIVCAGGGIRIDYGYMSDGYAYSYINQYCYWLRGGRLNLYRDGSLIKAGGLEFGSVASSFVDYPGAGGHTYSLQYNLVTWANASGTGSLSHRYINVLEIKK